MISEHVAVCGVPLDLDDVNKHMGMSVVQNWTCPKCNQKLKGKNCKWIKTEIVEDGRKWSRPQPELNVRIAKGGHENGINADKVIGLVEGSLGIKMPDKRNYRHTQRKVWDAQEKLFHIRQEENLAKHVADAKQLPEYQPLEFEYNGETHTTNPSTVIMDGGGKKRAFNHRINGDETGFIVTSGVNQRPIALVHSQVSILCQFIFFINYI